jgi:hypothetical protein
MAYVSPSNKTTGTLITATEWNQSIVANSQAGAPDVFLLNGDLFVGTAADGGDRLNAGNGGQIMRTNWGGTPSLVWGGLIDGRQGGGTVAGTADPWYSAGTANAAAAALGGHFQVGCTSLVIANGQTVGSTNVTYPMAYAYAPLVLATPSGTQACMMAALPVNGTSKTQGAFVATRTGSTGDGTITVSWVAIGAFSYDAVLTPRP